MKKCGIIILSILLLFVVACDKKPPTPNDKDPFEFELVGSMRTQYFIGDTNLDFNDLAIKRSRGDEVLLIPVTSSMIYGEYDLSKAGEYTLTLKYDIKSWELKIKVVEASITSIQLIFPDDFTSEYFEGDQLDLRSLKLMINFSDGKTAYISVTEDMISNADMKVLGKHTVIVNYAGLATEFQINVNSLEIANVNLINEGFNGDYTQYDDAVFDGLSLQVNFVNGRTLFYDITADLVKDFDTFTSGAKQFTISFRGYEFSVPYTVSRLPETTDPELFSYAQDEYGGYSIALSHTVNIGGNIILPRVYGDKFITSIAPGAFEDSQVSSVEIFRKVKAIGENAFSNSTLQRINLEEVEIIEDEAFKDCRYLNDFTMNKIKVIGRSAFENCGTFTSMMIGGDIDTIGEKAFHNANSLITLSLNNVKNILQNAFDSCKALTTVDIKGLGDLGDSAFAGCDSLKTIRLPDNAGNIGNGVFMNCAALTEVDLPDNLTSLGKGVFSNCVALTRVDFPNIEYVPELTFNECTSLTEIALPDTLKSIGEFAFYNCEKLASLEIPLSCENIYDGAFYGCVGLKRLEILSPSCHLGSAVFAGWTEEQTIQFNVTVQQASELFNEDWEIGSDAVIIWKD